MTQAILLGAGLGSRLDSERGNGPKWLLKVEGQSLAQHLVNVLHANDVAEILLVRGALGGSVLSPSVAYADVIGSLNMLDTLHEVRGHVHDDVIIAYCDLLLEPRVIGSVVDYKGPAGVVVDLSWYNLFSLRGDDPIAIAESCRLANGRLVEIGQTIIKGRRPEAQYVGIMRFSRAMFDSMMLLYDQLNVETAGRPWRNSRSFKAAYFTDFLQEMIDRGLPLDAICIQGGWLEFDTRRDLELARQLTSQHRPDIFDLAALPTLPSVLSAGGVAVREIDGVREVLLVGTGELGHWRIPKGMLNSGEKIESAARREVLEETGLEVRIEDLVDRAEWTYDHGGERWREQCYFYKLSTQACQSPRPDSEHAVAAWIPAGQAVSGMMYSEERGVLERALSWS